MTGLQKGLVAIVVVAVLATAAAISMRSGSGRGAAVRMAEIERQDLVASVTASGNIRARRSVDISSDVAARVAELLVEEGQEVDVGDVLLRLDRTQLEASRSRAQASVSQAQAQAAQQSANLTRQRREYDRVRGLWMRDSLLVSRQQVEDAETNLEVARANMDAAEYGVEVAQAALEEAEDRLAKTVFRAPIAGKVTRLNVEIGETVVVGTMNNAGSLILTVSDLSVVEVVVQMDETDVPRLALGDSASVDIDAFPDKSFTARVTEIGNSAIRPPSQNAASGQQQAIDFEVVLTLDPTDVELRPDLSATASIVTDVRSDAVAVPIIALTVREDSTRAGEGEAAEIEGVFVVDAGTARFRRVTVGIAGDEFFEVVEGLEPGETVVSGPYQTIRTLRDGDPVRREDGPAEDAGGTGG
jgi:HlyD family secretion protein